MNIEKMTLNPFTKLNNDWALVTAGTKDNFNSMTISWGGFGVLWNKNVATIYIKPSRYTCEFLKNNDYFTISFYDNNYKKDLGVMGSVSGRDVKKLSMTKLTPNFLEKGISYKESNLTLVCKKIYTSQLEESNIPDFAKKTFYNNDEGIHYIFIGEIVDILEKE